LSLLETKQVAQSDIQGASFITGPGIVEKRNCLYIKVYQLELLPFEN
jgi:hypothetical protein